MVACWDGRALLGEGTGAGKSGREEVELVSVEKLCVLVGREGLGGREEAGCD